MRQAAKHDDSATLKIKFVSECIESYQIKFSFLLWMRRVLQTETIFAKKIQMIYYFRVFFATLSFHFVVYILYIYVYVI